MGPHVADTGAQPSLHAFFKRKTPPSSPSLKSPSVTPTAKEQRQRSGTRVLHERQDDIVDLSGSPPPPKRLKLGNGEDDGISFSVGGTRKTSLNVATSGYFSKRVKNGWTPQLDQMSSKGDGINTFTDDHDHPDPSELPESSEKPATVIQSNLLESYRYARPPLPKLSQSDSAFGYHGAGTSGGMTALQSDTHPRDSLPIASQVRTIEQEKRHQEWQRRIMAPGGIVPRRRSLALDEAAAAEARLQAGEENHDDEENETPQIDDVAGDEEEENRRIADRVGTKLKEKYAAKGLEAVKGKAKGKGKKKEEEVGPSGQTYTPLEKQFMEIKADNADVLLMMEVGYKYKFYGEDAKIASKELGIASFPARNFYTASIPTHRLHIHTKKLISLGYKVGVISQTETAALKKVGDNRNAPFTRELTHLFTAATYVEDPSLGSSSNLADEPVVPGSASPPTNALVAVVEQGMGGMETDDRVRIGLVSVIPTTGEVVWDEFDDSQVRSELETRLTHLQPAELLLPASGLSKATEKILRHYAGHTSTSGRSSVRLERIQNIPTYDRGFDFLTRFYRSKTASKIRYIRPKLGHKASEEVVDISLSDDEAEGSAAIGTFRDDHKNDDSGLRGKEPDSIGLAAGLPAEEAVLALVDFPKQIVAALAVAVKYMKAFGLENAFRHRSSFTRFVNRAHMLLSSNTVVNLEVYRNQTDGSVYGSLLWLLDHTKTRMGRRLLREWIGRPLLDVTALHARVDAVEEILDNNSYHMEKLRSLLVNMPDLVRGLTRIQYGKATPTELATVLVGLTRIGSEFKPHEGDAFKSALLNNILKTLPTISETSRGFLDAINLKEARENDEGNLWADADKYPDIQDAKDCISICESELDQHLNDIRKTLKRPSLAFVTVSAIEYLVEVPVRDAKSVPPKWVKISSTKSVIRFHTPDVLRITREREQHKETLTAAAHRALQSFQSDISECHSLVIVSRQIAVIDCLMSFAQVAAASGYCKPEFVSEPNLRIRDGRHPMVEMLRDEAYVPFHIDFSEQHGIAKVITGPNMAGKSSCVRATALIVCMAQIGSFVPASSVSLGVHDAVQTRMGASDEIGRGKSTFMVELSETSDILRTITPRTLVILDELGRGTSTYDGVAIAYATLSHLAAIGCNTLFVTHYPMVAEELAKEYPTRISNWHMSFDEIISPDGSAEITFLYKLTRGLAEASFGVWCARLAGLPRVVLKNAQLRADHLKLETQKRLLVALTRRSRQLLKSSTVADVDTPSTDILRNVTLLHKALALTNV